MLGLSLTLLPTYPWGGLLGKPWGLSLCPLHPWGHCSSRSLSLLLFAQVETRLQRHRKAHTWGFKMSVGNLEPPHPGHCPMSIGAGLWLCSPLSPTGLLSLFCWTGRPTGPLGPSAQMHQCAAGQALRPCPLAPQLAPRLRQAHTVTWWQMCLPALVTLHK